jgi:transposase
MATSIATVEIQVNVPAGVSIGEYERIADGHAFHVRWDLPPVCRCETCQRETPLQRIDKNKFLAIRDLDLWGQPSFFVYQEVQHRCPCGHRQSLIPPFKRKDVKYTLRFEDHVLTSLIGSTAQDVAQRLGISAETVERIVRNRLEESKAKKIQTTVQDAVGNSVAPTTTATVADAALTAGMLTPPTATAGGGDQ